MGDSDARNEASAPAQGAEGDIPAHQFTQEEFAKVACTSSLLQTDLVLAIIRYLHIPQNGSR